MRVHITATPEFPIDTVKEVVLILNETSGILEFMISEPLEVRQFSAMHKQMADIAAIDKLTFEEFFALCNTVRLFRTIPDDDFVVLVTSIKNTEEWFSAFDSKNIFIHGEEWEYYTKRDSKYGIAYQIVENIFQSLIELNIDDRKKEPNIHEPSIGCINDYCAEKFDVMLKFRTADICESCLKRAEQKNIDPLILDHIYRIINNLRTKFVSSYLITSKIKPKKVYIDPNREVTIGPKKLRLDALKRVVFIFFLKNLDGIETKLISKCEDDLYQIYKEVRDNPKRKTIKNVTSDISTFEPCRSKLNKALIKQLGPNLAEYYILDSVEIKDDYNRYKINLDKEYITIEPSKRR